MTSISKEGLQELKKLGLTFEGEWNKTEVHLTEEAKRLDTLIKQNEQIIKLLKGISNGVYTCECEKHSHH